MSSKYSEETIKEFITAAAICLSAGHTKVAYHLVILAAESLETPPAKGVTNKVEWVKWHRETFGTTLAEASNRANKYFDGV